jgi:uncharacterized protein YcbK (DUF882 family)
MRGVIFFLVTVALATSASAARSHREVPAAELFALNRNERFSLRPGPAGGFTKMTMSQLARFLRCHHTQRRHAIAPRLARLLYETAKHFDFARLEIVAGYRAPSVAREKGNPKSPHKRGVACDFRVVGVANEVLRDYVRNFPKVGVGYYPNSGFVHLDVRGKLSAFWVDYSAPGERAKYSRTPEEDVRKREQEADTDAEGEQPQLETTPGGSTPNSPAPVEATPQKN